MSLHLLSLKIEVPSRSGEYSRSTIYSEEVLIGKGEEAKYAITRVEAAEHTWPRIPFK